MSIRNKVLILFLLLAVAPLVTVAVFDYAQSVSALESLVASQNRQLAEQAAREIRQRFEVRRADLRVAADAPAVVGLARWAAASPGADPPEAVATAGRDAVARTWALYEPWLHALEVVSPENRSLLWFGAGPEQVDRLLAGCIDGRAPAVSLREPVLGEAGDTVGWLRGIADFPSVVPVEALQVRVGTAGGLAVVDRSDGSVIYHPGCGSRRSADSLPAILPLGTDPGVLPPGDYVFPERDGQRVASLATLADPPWTVVSSTVPGEFTEPFARTRLVYLMLVFFIALAAGLAFSILLGRVMLSLGDLTEAADEIGRGNFTPPLPPPGTDEVGRLSYALALMSERLRTTMRQVELNGKMAVLGEFAAQVSHEVRNPLSSIKLNLQTLVRAVKRGKVPEEYGESVDICLAEIQRLDRTVRTMLELGRTRSGERAPCSIHEVVDEALAVVRPSFARSGVEVEVDLAAPVDRVMADAEQVKGVFLNLFLNAAQAMDGRGTIRVRSQLGHRNEGEPVLVVHVRDTGPGIPPDLRDVIFNPFFTTKADGTGLGLAIASRTVEEHGGALYLEVRSELESGAEFVIELPLAGAHPEDPYGPRRLARAGAVEELSV